MLLRNLHLIDGDGSDLGFADLRIVGEAIDAIGPRLPALPDEESLDLTGRSALPGYINVHTHLWIDASPDPDYVRLKESIPEIAVSMAQRAERALRAGVTTVREAGTPHRVDLAIKRMIDAGTIPGPFMHAAGNYICMTGGHGHHIAGHEADGPDEVRAATRYELKSGASVVKLIVTGGIVTQGTEPGATQMTEAEIRAAVEEAHKAGRLTFAHAEGAEGILFAVRAGVDSIEHGFWLTDEAIDLMLERATYYCPTLAADWLLLEAGVEGGVPAFQVEKLKRTEEAHRESVVRAARAGVKITCGTDAGTAYNPAENTPAESEFLVRLGLSPAYALSTIGRSAEAMGLSDRGYLRPGRRADIVILSANPLNDIRAARQVELVFQAGRPLTAKAMQ